MLELVEARILAEQMNLSICGKRISKVTTLHSPHKFAFFHGDPQTYDELLRGRQIGKAAPVGGQLRLEIEDLIFVFGDGVDLRYLNQDEKRPSKHQLLIEFEDGSALSGSIQMYGFLSCVNESDFDSPYYLVAKKKPSPITEEFDMKYFLDILSAPGAEKLSAKAVLATEQRIPGLGNGVLQDILYYANLHPKRKVATFSEEDKDRLFHSIKSTLAQMIELGGRDTEKDLYGVAGRYVTRASKNSVGKPCSICGHPILKEAYLGGSIYYCEGCQVLVK
ncbi:MAG: glycosylase/AP lyase, DNA-binding [Herbinix sp.]|jgi:formamidopyrimidine-DNA glycosylase|nr:glycosylase/AP lyase, DNA-binding [Herbinix sp.]